DRGRSVWRAVQGGVLRAGGCGNRLSSRARHGCGAACRRPFGDIGRGWRDRRDDRGGWLVRVGVLPAASVSDEPIIEVDHVAQRFGSRTIFRDVSLRVYPREVFVILGGSGCGKSTLMKQLIGLLVPSAGRISLFGEAIT